MCVMMYDSFNISVFLKLRLKFKRPVFLDPPFAIHLQALVAWIIVNIYLPITTLQLFYLGEGEGVPRKICTYDGGRDPPPKTCLILDPFTIFLKTTRRCDRREHVRTTAMLAKLTLNSLFLVFFSHFYYKIPIFHALAHGFLETVTNIPPNFFHKW